MRMQVYVLPNLTILQTLDFNELKTGAPGLIPQPLTIYGVHVMPLIINNLKGGQTGKHIAGKKAVMCIVETNQIRVSQRCISCYFCFNNLLNSCRLQRDRQCPSTICDIDDKMEYLILIIVGVAYAYQSIKRRITDKWLWVNYNVILLRN